MMANWIAMIQINYWLTPNYNDSRMSDLYFIQMTMSAHTGSLDNVLYSDVSLSIVTGCTFIRATACENHKFVSTNQNGLQDCVNQSEIITRLCEPIRKDYTILSPIKNYYKIVSTN